ncbi:MAG TPA: DUF3619 family protein [Burkholderiales bacterium]|nr:DUF3619 family protein [Burkholderiales bacterium]
MNEDDLARRIVGQLDRNLAELPASATQKLQAARMVALARYRADLPQGRARALALPRWFSGRSLTLRLALPLAIVIASITGLLFWQMSAPHEDELDTGLLAGELPIHAYIDPGFDTWLQHTSHTPQQ